MFKKLMLSSLLLTSGIAAANGSESSLHLGLGIAVSPEFYKQQDNKTIPIPLIRYEDKHFFFRGIQAGAYLYKKPYTSLSFVVDGDMQQFDPDEANNQNFKKLNLRKASLNTGLEWSMALSKQNGIKVSLLKNINNSHQSWIPSIELQHRIFDLIPDSMIMASVQALYASKDYNQYYYGVTNNESLKTGLATYTPNSSIEWNLSGAWFYKISPKLSSLVMLKYQHLNSDLKNSPLVEKTQGISSFIGIQYQWF